MRLYQLKKGDRFKMIGLVQDANEKVSEMTGKFLGMDGMWGKCLFDDLCYDDKTSFSICHAMEEVEVLE